MNNMPFRNDDSALPLSTLSVSSSWRIPWRWIVFFGGIGLFFILLSTTMVRIAYIGKIERLQSVGMPKAYGIVLGAAVKADGTPSDALQDRLDTAIALYKSGMIKYVLLTGDGGGRNVDEISAMNRVILDAGIPQKNIILDKEGYRTYESCSRAISVYYVPEAYVITQKFHLSRALFLCNELGMDATGVIADKSTYKDIEYFKLREFFASVKAFMDVYMHKPDVPVKVNG